MTPWSLHCLKPPVADRGCSGTSHRWRQMPCTGVSAHGARLSVRQALVYSRGQQLCFLTVCHTPSGAPVVRVLGGGEWCCCGHPRLAVQGRLSAVEHMRAVALVLRGGVCLGWIRNTKPGHRAGGTLENRLENSSGLPGEAEHWAAALRAQR